MAKTTRQQRRHRSAAEPRRKIAFPLLILALVVFGGGAVALTVMDRGRPLAMPEGVQEHVVESRDHVEGPVDYDVIPPVGGPHWSVWHNCGFYSEPIVAEAAVHSLEHGAVWVTWDPSLDEREIRPIRQLATTRSYVVASPWPSELPAPVIASTWGYQIHLDGPDDERLDQFVRYFAGAQFAPEPGGACHGGIGTPER